MKLMQVSLYPGDSYIGTVARADDGTFTSGADPWVGESLFSYSKQPGQTGPPRQYRLLDAIYSSAARNNVPTAVIGEAIMLMSRKFDLTAFATDQDRIDLVYSDQPRDGNLGRVLYAAVRGPQRDLECYVFKPPGSSDFACMDDGNANAEDQRAQWHGDAGERRDDVDLRPQRAARAEDGAHQQGRRLGRAGGQRRCLPPSTGWSRFAGDGKDYGNIVRISHSGRRETLYAHLSRFDGAAKPGATSRPAT